MTAPATLDEILHDEVLAHWQLGGFTDRKISIMKSAILAAANAETDCFPLLLAVARACTGNERAAQTLAGQLQHAVNLLTITAQERTRQ
jgi:hypothetical protein